MRNEKWVATMHFSDKSRINVYYRPLPDEEVRSTDHAQGYFMHILDGAITEGRLIFVLRPPYYAKIDNHSIDCLLLNGLRGICRPGVYKLLQHRN